MKRILFVLFLCLIAGFACKAQTVYTVNYKSDAKVKVYVTKYKSDADLVVYFADYKSDAGWRNKSKMHLMY